MRAFMIVGLMAVLLIVGILTMQQMGVGFDKGQTPTPTREYIDQAQGAIEALEEKMQGRGDQLNPAD